MIFFAYLQKICINKKCAKREREAAAYLHLILCQVQATAFFLPTQATGFTCTLLKNLVFLNLESLGNVWIPKFQTNLKFFKSGTYYLLLHPFLRNIFLHFLQCMLSIKAYTNGGKIFFLYRWLDNCVRCAAIPDPILYSCSSESTAKFLPQKKNIFWGRFFGIVPPFWNDFCSSFTICVA